MTAHRPGRGEARKAQVRILDEPKRAASDDRTLDRGAAHFAVALRGVGVSHGEQRAGHLDGEVQARARAQVADVQVAADAARRHDAVQTCLGGATPIVPQNGLSGTRPPAVQRGRKRLGVVASTGAAQAR